MTNIPCALTRVVNLAVELLCVLGDKTTRSLLNVLFFLGQRLSKCLLVDSVLLVIVHQQLLLDVVREQRLFHSILREVSGHHVHLCHVSNYFGVVLHILFLVRFAFPIDHHFASHGAPLLTWFELRSHHLEAVLVTA